MQTQIRLPEGWEVRKLGDMAKVTSGGTPSRSKTEYWENGTISWLKISDLKPFYVRDSEEKITEEGLKNSSAKIFPKGTILFTVFATLGDVAILDIDATTNQAISGIFINDESKVNKLYLAYYLKSLKYSWIKKSKGVTQRNINQTIVKNTLVPIPPLPTQQKIVARLDAFFEHYNKLKKEKQKAKEKYEQIIQSAIASFIAKGEWQKSELGEICVINPPKKEVKDFSDDLEVSFVPMSFVDDKEGIIKKQEIKKLAEVRRGYTYFKENDVLFAKITPCMENGKAAIAKNLKNDIGFGSTEFHVIRPNENILPEFIFYYIRQPFFRGEAASKMSGTAGQLRVPKRFLEDYEIPLPPIEEQKKIVKLLEKIKLNSSSIYEQQKNIDYQLEQLPKAVLSKAFRGELVS